MKKTITTNNHKTIEIEFNHDELINFLCPELKGVNSVITQALLDDDSRGIFIVIEVDETNSTSEEV